MWADSDKVFSSFFQQCLKTPEQCALASRNQTAEQLEESIYQLLDDLKREPIVYEHSIIDHSYMKTYIRFALYGPSSYPSLAAAFNFILDGNVTGFKELADARVGSLLAAGMAGDDAAFAIPCADKKTGKHTLDEIMPDLNTLSQTSKLLGEVGNAIAMTCTQWKFDAKERYEGNFESKTKNPIMVIGNTYDSATPLRSAQNISASFEGSVLLEHGGWGVSPFFVGYNFVVPGLTCYYSTRLWLTGLHARRGLSGITGRMVPFLLLEQSVNQIIPLSNLAHWKMFWLTLASLIRNKCCQRPALAQRSYLSFLTACISH